MEIHLENQVLVTVKLKYLVILKEVEMEILLKSIDDNNVITFRGSILDKFYTIMKIKTPNLTTKMEYTVFYWRRVT